MRNCREPPFVRARPMDSFSLARAAPWLEEIPMKTNVYFGLAAAALALTLQASSATARAVHSPIGNGCISFPHDKGRGYPVPCPEEGFGSRTPVTLPPDRHPPAGTSTGIPVRNGTARTIPPLNYFRPR